MNLSETQTMEEILEWVARRNHEIAVEVSQVPFSELFGWHFDAISGNLVHNTGRFFSIVGLDVTTNAGGLSHWQQPIINQPEIGYLGMLCKNFGDKLHFLLQAKIEPGNVNSVQLSPTLQATRSNYTLVHGGKKPKYLEYFVNARQDQIIVDQLQSEQGARFFRKRNRNIIVKTDEDIKIDDDFRWVTMDQIKRLITYDNTVNMDTRTVLSCYDADTCRDEYSVMTIDEILHRLSELKTKYELIAEKIPLKSVRDWDVSEREISRPDKKFFKVIGAKVSIANREVSSWCQPLVTPMQEGLFVLFTKQFKGVMHYLLQAKIECGNFDVVELAPSIQCLTDNYRHYQNEEQPTYLPEFISGKLPGKFKLDVLQSEEGGRFYHEQNRNVIYELDDSVELPAHENYFWLTKYQIKQFLKFNNYLNIQLRSLVAAL